MQPISRYYPAFQEDLDKASAYDKLCLPTQAQEKLREIDKNIGSIYRKSDFCAHISQCVKDLFGYESPASFWGAGGAIARAVYRSLIHPSKNLAAAAKTFSKICGKYEIIMKYRAAKYLKAQYSPFHSRRMNESLTVDSPNLIQEAIEDKTDAMRKTVSEWISQNPGWTALAVTVIPAALYLSKRCSTILLAGTGFGSALTFAALAYQGYQMLGN
jgi:hypothetical protein